VTETKDNKSHNEYITLQSRALLERLLVVQLLKNYLAFYGTRRLITVFNNSPPMVPYPEPDQSE
jgi:hypothetical protein